MENNGSWTLLFIFVTSYCVTKIRLVVEIQNPPDDIITIYF